MRMEDNETEVWVDYYECTVYLQNCRTQAMNPNYWLLALTVQMFFTPPSILLPSFTPFSPHKKRDETNAQRDGCMDRKMLRDKINTPSSSKKKTKRFVAVQYNWTGFSSWHPGRSRSLSLSQLVHCHRLLSLIKEKGVSFVKKINLEDKTPQRLGMKKMEKNIFLSLVHLKKRNL